ncbi:hypothetical protein D9619_006560 [Psilocybe cf. subviscida]|uniref:NAD(P)-binding protein n=1 Tax=Psilocybe cf. subviscida TaxID=2480587 RepID=A0A8H5EY57_9AGAR|nr:hypothetical protein D9619_006560 [Psilocybe cf. subviscida]
MPPKFSLLKSFQEQRMPWPPAPKVDLQGKTVIVTGSNIGIGFEAAKHFAQMNPEKLILACRNKDKGQAALKILEAETGCHTAEVWSLDLASFDSVRAFADKFNKECPRLDILVENAAILPAEPYVMTSDGWEATFEVNNLSTSLLGLLLVPRMLETAEKFATTPRIVVVSSNMHMFSRFGPEMMDSSNPLEKFGKDQQYLKKIIAVRYQDTKLLNIFFARSLSKRIPANKVIVNMANPGYVYSNLRSSFTGVRKVFDYLMEKALARTTEEGSRHVVWAAVGGENEPKERLQGAYVHMCSISEVSEHVLSEEGTRHEDKLWDNLIDILSEVEPKVQTIVNGQLTKLLH